ncbi:MAG: MMPL family transporter [Pseudomonadales bacterium]|nr:MMPL family transporter [Pseudomonadales bacterium]
MSPRNFTEWLLAHRILVLLASFIVLISCVAGVQRLDFSADYRVLFSDKNPQLKAFEEMEEIYGKRDNLMIAVAPDDGNVFTKETLKVIASITEKAWETPYSVRVDSVTNFQHTTASEDDLTVASLFENIDALSTQDIEERRKISIAEPLLYNRMISETGHVAAINIMINTPENATLEQQFEIVNYVRDLITEAEANTPNIKYYLTGETLMGFSAIEAAMYDGKTLFPIMYVLILLITYLFLRSAWGVFSVLVIIILSTAAAIGLTGWVGIQLSTLSAMAPVIILTLAVADSVHILVTVFQEMSEGTGKREAIVRSMEVNHQPIFLTSITTAIGFISLNSSDVPPFGDMGNIVAMGVLMAWFYSIVTLPVILDYLPLKARERSVHSEALMNRLADYSLKRRNELGVAFSLILVFGAYCSTLNQFNDLFPEMYGEQITFRQHTDFVRENLTGVMQIHHAIRAKEANGVYEPEYLRQLDRLTAWYGDQTGVTHVESYSSTIKRINKSLHADQNLYYRIPDTREEAAQYQFLFELSLPYGLDMDNILTSERDESRLTVTMGNVESRDLVILEARARTYAEKYLPDIQLMEGVGASVMMGHAARRNGESMMLGAPLAVMIISLIVIISLKSFKLGVLSLLPNLAPGIIAFGLWGVLDGKLGIAAAPTATIAFGIVVDNTIHFFSKYLRAKRVNGYSTEEAIHYSFHRVGTALGTTTTILASGFLVLALSAMAPNLFMGLMTAISLVISLGITYFILPTLLSYIDKDVETEQVSKELKKVA